MPSHRSNHSNTPASTFICRLRRRKMTNDNTHTHTRTTHKSEIMSNKIPLSDSARLNSLPTIKYFWRVDKLALCHRVHRQWLYDVSGIAYKLDITQHNMTQYYFNTMIKRFREFMFFFLSRLIANTLRFFLSGDKLSNRLRVIWSIVSLTLLSWLIHEDDQIRLWIFRQTVLFVFFGWRAGDVPTLVACLNILSMTHLNWLTVFFIYLSATYSLYAAQCMLILSNITLYHNRFKL